LSEQVHGLVSVLKYDAFQLAEWKLRMMAETLLTHLRYVATCARKTTPALSARNAAQQPVAMHAMIQSFLWILREFKYDLVFLVKKIFVSPCYSIIDSQTLKVHGSSSKEGHYHILGLK
jgi:hypothetical protein